MRASRTEIFSIPSPTRRCAEDASIATLHFLLYSILPLRKQEGVVEKVQKWRNISFTSKTFFFMQQRTALCISCTTNTGLQALPSTTSIGYWNYRLSIGFVLDNTQYLVDRYWWYCSIPIVFISHILSHFFPFWIGYFSFTFFRVTRWCALSVAWCLHIIDVLSPHFFIVPFSSCLFSLLLYYIRKKS